ncbi:MAG TPA: hypothetical protein PK156_21785, partial [Polyangium sp.]|nr:hypothetical protein [Polyangium sp.]
MRVGPGTARMIVGGALALSSAAVAGCGLLFDLQPLDGSGLPGASGGAGGENGAASSSSTMNSTSSSGVGGMGGMG